MPNAPSKANPIQAKPFSFSWVLNVQLNCELEIILVALEIALCTHFKPQAFDFEFGLRSDPINSGANMLRVFHFTTEKSRVDNRDQSRKKLHNKRCSRWLKVKQTKIYCARDRLVETMMMVYELQLCRKFRIFVNCFDKMMMIINREMICFM